MQRKNIILKIAEMTIVAETEKSEGLFFYNFSISLKKMVQCLTSILCVF